MKEKRQNRKLAILLAALALVAVMAVGPVRESLAYFTTQNENAGSYSYSYELIETGIIETFDGLNKHVTLKNTGKADCFVRVKAFSSNGIALTIAGSGWSLAEDGYWYYANVLAPGEVSQELVVEVTYPAKYERDFNIIIVQECAPVVSDELGTLHADWDMKISGEETVS